MTKHARSFLQVLFALISTFALSGCFTSTELLKEQRIWELAWQGRYEGQHGAFEYVVLAADPLARTYLIAQFGREKKEVKTFRGALYPGWGDVFILGTLETGFRTTVNYHLVRRISKDRFDVVAPSCHGKSDAAGVDPCSFGSIDVLREALKAAHTEALDRAKRENTSTLVERVTAPPPSTLGIATELATFEDGDGIHGALRIAPNAPRPSGMNADELVVAVNGREATSGGALLLMIAFEKPGAQIRLSLLDPKTGSRRDITLKTVALPAS